MCLVGMKTNLYSLLREGHAYISLWPSRQEFLEYFAEYRAVVACRFAVKYCPYLAMLALILPLLAMGIEQLNMALFYSILIASMPIQALAMVAKQSKKKLPLALASWYRQGVEKLNPKPVPNLTLNNPTFNDLARLLNYSYNQA